ncbi:hypothetical protein SO802_000073 [Lithocarpus litseifolius]|uniref:RNase H type-1 domain-containing protein n=1 Tax=Lithocarpus litseifolius TaxID=425828 RepID=A0AAW2DSB0_9ROSI
MIVSSCPRHLITCFHRIRFNHCYRQANRCADLLARKGAIQDEDFIYFSSPPMEICNAFEDDCNGVWFNRMCPALDVAGCMADISGNNELDDKEQLHFPLV